MGGVERAVSADLGKWTRLSGSHLREFGQIKRGLRSEEKERLRSAKFDDWHVK